MTSGTAGNWPSWATAPIEVVDADPAWLARAESLAADLRVRVAPWLDGDVEHIGSTAVPDLPAKPVVDLMAPVRRLTDAPEADAALVPGGWEPVPPELDARPWRRFYVRADGDRRTAHLHLVERSHPRWAQALAFRDALRADGSLATEYAAIKYDAATRHGDDREAYTAAKSRFVARVLDGVTDRRS